MSNPIIIGRNSDLRTRRMFYLMKNVMKINQNIALTTIMTKNSFVESPGIIFQHENYDMSNLYGRKFSKNFQKPWIIVGQRSGKFSRIDEPLYELENGTVWENYEFKTIRKSRELAKIQGKEVKWLPRVVKKFYKRRGNFDNITLLAMTDTELSYNELPKNFAKDIDVSKDIPDTYEVRKKLISLQSKNFNNQLWFFCLP